MNLPSYIVLFVIALIVAFIIYRLIKNKGNNHCPYCSSCNLSTINKDLKKLIK